MKGGVARTKVLLTGSTGLLGLSLLRNRPAGLDVCAGYYNFPEESLIGFAGVRYVPLDIQKADEVSGVCEAVSPDIVVHTASIGNVDYCEKHRAQAWEVNVEGSRRIIEACKRVGAALLFTSSNAVFDGEHPPYAEDDAPNPIDYYGKTKQQTELDIAGSGLEYAIARLMTMYGWNHPRERSNPVTWQIEKLIKGEKVNIVDDIFNNHLFAGNAASAIWAIVGKQRRGIYHLAGGEIISRYGLALKVAQVFGLDRDLIQPVPSSFFSGIAPRPKNTSYAIGKMERELSVRAVSVNEGLSLMKKGPPQEWSYGWYP